MNKRLKYKKIISTINVKIKFEAKQRKKNYSQWEKIWLVGQRLAIFDLLNFWGFSWRQLRLRVKPICFRQDVECWIDPLYTRFYLNSKSVGTPKATRTHCLSLPRENARQELESWIIVYWAKAGEDFKTHHTHWLTFVYSKLIH